MAGLARPRRHSHRHRCHNRHQAERNAPRRSHQDDGHGAVRPSGDYSHLDLSRISSAFGRLKYTRGPVWRSSLRRVILPRSSGSFSSAILIHSVRIDQQRDWRLLRLLIPGRCSFPSVFLPACRTVRASLCKSGQGQRASDSTRPALHPADDRELLDTVPV